MLEADFVIVGSGSAGSALACRLSEDGRHSVIVIEYGGTDAGPFIQMPAALSFPMNMSRYDWGFATEPEPHLGGRVLATPRGKVIGGSSSINGMVYVRGHAHDFDHWAEEGAAGWSFADVLPYFKRMETSHGGEEGWRGTEGPLHVRRGPRKNPLYAAFVEAGRQAGFETTDDYNGSKQEGFGPMEQTIHLGRRWSAASAYLRPALKRRNVSLIRGFARKVVIENQRAVGVEIEAHRKIQLVKARREVVLAASSINSPKLLMLSGHRTGRASRKNGHRGGRRSARRRRQSAGPSGALHPAAVEPADHSLFQAQPVFQGDDRGGMDVVQVGAGRLQPFRGGRLRAFACRHRLSRTSSITSSPSPSATTARRRPRRTASRRMSDRCARSRAAPSRLRSPEPHDKPVIRFNYMSHPDDWADFRHCIRLTREIFCQSAFDPYRGPEISPGAHIVGDDELDGHIRDHVESAYHPCGTCRMGRAEDPASVVDPECRVIGVEGLRVADSSIFPRITNGNLNGPSIMVGEKAADHILGRPPLPPSNQRPWINPRWPTSDR